MSAPNKQPRNPFRTQNRGCDDHNDVLFANPFAQACYIAAVGALVIAVIVVAWTTFSQLPSPHEDSALVGPHRLAASDLNDIKILKPARAGGGGVRSQARIPQIAETTVGALLEKMARVLPSASSERTNVDGRSGEDDSSEEGLESFHHDDDANEVVVHDAGEQLLRPAIAHSKLLGETKEQVKQEMNREEFSDHVFGVQRGDKESKSLTDYERADYQGEARRGNSTDNKPENYVDNAVHVVQRKGELETLLAAVDKLNEDNSISASVNATIRLQPEISLDEVADDRRQGGNHAQADPFHKNVERVSGSARGEEKDAQLRRSRIPLPQ